MGIDNKHGSAYMRIDQVLVNNSVWVIYKPAVSMMPTR